jgi:hypothetical protein
MCVVRGIPYFLIRIEVGKISPLMLVFSRTAIGGLILAPIVLAKGGLRGIGRKWIARRLLSQYSRSEAPGPSSRALNRISPARWPLLNSCVPLIGIVVSPLFGGQRSLGLRGPERAGHWTGRGGGNCRPRFPTSLTRRHSSRWGW